VTLLQTAPFQKQKFICCCYKKEGASFVSQNVDVTLPCCGLIKSMVIWVPCNQGMARPEVAQTIGDHQCGLHATDTSHSSEIRKKCRYNERVHKTFEDLKKTYDSARREVLYNIRIEFGVSMKLVRVLKICLKWQRGKVLIGKHLS
jgi:hypothetical protein